MQNHEAKGMFSIIKEIGSDVTIGTIGYFAAIELNWIQEAQHIVLGLISALVCCAGVHYFKKLLVWLDVAIPKLIRRIWK